MLDSQTHNSSVDDHNAVIVRNGFADSKHDLLSANASRVNDLDEIVRSEARGLMSEVSPETIGRRYDQIVGSLLLLFATPFVVLTCWCWTGGGSLSAVMLFGSVGGVFAGLALYSMFGFVHDGAHGNIPKTSLIARRINLLVMPLMGVSTYTYRKAHLAHHNHLGHCDKDPQYAPFEEIEEPRQHNFLSDGGPLELHAPVRNFFLILTEIGGIIQRREPVLFRSLFDHGARRDLYERFSFMGVKRSGLNSEYFALPPKHCGTQRVLDYARIGIQVAVVGLLFVSPWRVLSIALVIAIIVAAVLNAARSSREHTGYRNDGDIFEFNQYNSSNTPGNGLLNRLLWFPGPFHALHHSAPRIPFFLLAELNERVRNRLLTSE